jgi:hypothetical protein
MLKEKIKEDKSSKNIDRGQLNKRNKTPRDALEHLTKTKEGQAGEALKTRVKWTWDFGFKVLTPRLWFKVFRESCNV